MPLTDIDWPSPTIISANTGSVLSLKVMDDPGLDVAPINAIGQRGEMHYSASSRYEGIRAAITANAGQK